MNIRQLIVVAVLLAMSVTVRAECRTDGASGEEVMGTLLGAALGGLVGSQIGSGTGRSVAIGAGVLAGGYMGNRIGARMSCADQEYHYDTTQSSLEYQPTGRTAAWKNPGSSASGAVTPTRTYIGAGGTPCRDFTQTVTVDGQRESIQATACRNDDGTWQIVDG